MKARHGERRGVARRVSLQGEATDYRAARRPRARIQAGSRGGGATASTSTNRMSFPSAQESRQVFEHLTANDPNPKQRKDL